MRHFSDILPVHGSVLKISIYSLLYHGFNNSLPLYTQFFDPNLFFLIKVKAEHVPFFLMEIIKILIILQQRVLEV